MISHETIKYRGVELDIEFIFTKGEPSTIDYPGSYDEVEITSIEHLGVDVWELLEDQIELITEKIIDTL